jgi:hypothetical protein
MTAAVDHLSIVKVLWNLVVRASTRCHAHISFQHL